MKSKLISKILGIGVAASTVIALGGAFLAASPAAADTTKWTSINTPNWEDGVVLPANDILDYDISGDDGNTIYVVAEVDRNCADDNPVLDDAIDNNFGPGDIGYGLLKSTNGGVTWKDITAEVISAENLPDFNPIDSDWGVSESDILSLNFVAVSLDDPDWVAVTGYGNYAQTDDLPNDKAPFTVASKNGGDDFAYAGQMNDPSHGTYGTSMDIVYDTEVSPETADGTHLIAAMGFSYVPFFNTDNPGVPTSYMPGSGTVFILDAGTWLTGNWEDTSFWDGWDGLENGNNDIGTGEGIFSVAEIDGEFSPNFADDFTFVVIGVAQTPETASNFGPDAYLPYLQTGDLDSKQWGVEASLPDPIQIKNESDTLVQVPGIWLDGIALPADYDGSDSGSRIVFGYVDALNWTTETIGGFVFRIDNSDVSPQVAPSGDPGLASIAVSGDADTGKMMIGEVVKLDGPADACAGVRVWHTEELDICCPKWELCCKCPSGTYAARVVYTPDGSKEYATTTSSDADHMFDGINPADMAGWGTRGDETAFSVSLDDATSWNQIGLIDTNIDKLSDLAVCPDCSVMYLSTINGGDLPEYYCGDWYCPAGDSVFSCDSVWRSFDNGDTWERVNHGDWQDTTQSYVPDPGVTGELLLRLPCEDTENCCDYTDPSAPGGTIYLGVQATDDMFYSRDCGQCWTKTPDTKIDIQDFAVDTESTVYVLDDDGNVSKSTNFGRRWSDSTDTGAGSGHMITVCCAQGMVVVGPENWDGGDAVAWSDDAGATWNTTDDIPVNGEVHVACATTCENTIYIATYYQGGGIWRGDMTDGSWTDMGAADTGYTGIAVGKSDGTLYASTNYIAVADNEDAKNDFGDWTPCLRTFGEAAESDTYGVSAVARNLDPCTTACCGTEDWDYLICGLDKDGFCSGEDFDAQVNALDICGCLTSATNTKLYAIDSQQYDVRDGDNGTIWTYEDCASKVGPTLVSPADGSVLDCIACEGCNTQPFTLKWNRMCNSCSYDIEIMDEDANVVASWTDITLTGTTPTLYVNGNSEEADGPVDLVCGSTYQWHVREANTDCECIHSRWSATWTFTVATSSLNGVQLISPKMAANDIGTANIGFSWTSVPEATSYSLVVSPNANLSGALVSQEISTTAFNFAGPLEKEKTYYWQVKAWKDTTLLSTSSVGVFTIAPAPAAPTPPVVVQQTPAPTITIPPTQQITPTWIYAIIGIGAALAVVVIVLIVRTRKP